MPVALQIATLWLVLNHLKLLAFTGEDDRTLDLCTLDSWCTDGRVRAIVDEENLIENDFVALLQVTRKLLNRNSIALRDDILLATGLDYGHFHSATNVAF